MRAKIMSLFSWAFSVEGVLRVCEITAIVAGALAVAALIGKDLAGRAVADRKAREMQVLQKDVADARTKQAEAETRLLELQQFVTKPRGVNTDNAFEVLRAAPKGTVFIRYVENNEDALDFSMYLFMVVRSVGWKTERPASGTKRVPSTGITLEYRSEADAHTTFTEADLSPSGKALYKALQGGRRVGEIRLQPREDLPVDTFFVIVGPKL